MQNGLDHAETQKNKGKGGRKLGISYSTWRPLTPAEIEQVQSSSKTQRELGALAGINRACMTKVVRGERRLSPAAIEQLLQAAKDSPTRNAPTHLVTALDAEILRREQELAALRTTRAILSGREL